jgi:DNA (cytosine-5)-methyltransferase 1
MYNENEPFAIQWLEQLQERNLIPKGKIDGRSITDIRPEDCDRTSHFFAGIGGWAYALQLAGWNPARDVWTGSCPCQPFSIAGKGTGTSDKRHLWPIWRELIAECRPSVIFGEQTSSKLGREWLSGVRTDLEALGYAVGAADLCAASVNAPHRRQRLYWVAYTGHGGDRGPNRLRDSAPGAVSGAGEDKGSGQGRQDTSRVRTLDVLTDGCQVYDPVDGLVNTLRGGASNPDTEAKQGSDGQDFRVSGQTGLSDFWDQFDIAECRAIDGSVQYRRIEPGLLPVVDGIPSRLRAGLIRGYGNAIVPQLAATFIRSFLEAEGEA